MLNWMIEHPFLLLAIAWGGIICLYLFLSWRRGDRGGYVEVPMDRISFRAALIKANIAPRLNMRSRYMPKKPDTERSENMAAQILADQAGANAKPGPVVRRPAPGEEGYREPIHSFAVTVGHFDVLLCRDGSVRVIEQTTNGAISPPYDVPERWSELVAALAFEVGRLRDGV